MFKARRSPNEGTVEPSMGAGSGKLASKVSRETAAPRSLVTERRWEDDASGRTCSTALRIVR